MFFSKIKKNNKKPTKKTTSKSKVVVGGNKKNNKKPMTKKKLALFSVSAVLVLSALGFGGNYLKQKYFYSQLAKYVNTADAASLEYKYGKHFQIKDKTKYERLLVEGYICRRNSTTVSIFSIRRGVISQAFYTVSARNNPGILPTWLQSGNAYVTNWWNNMNITNLRTISQSYYVPSNLWTKAGYNLMLFPNANIVGDASHGTYRSDKDVKLAKTWGLPPCRY